MSRGTLDAILCKEEAALWKKGQGRDMTRELVAAMDEYLEAANSLERWDLSAGEASPVLDALRIAHRNLLNELEAFEATVGGQGTALGPKATADLVALSG